MAVRFRLPRQLMREAAVRTTFGRRGPFSELMILTPKENNPSLNVCFSGKLKNFANQ